jgi:hypothetical protein
MDFGRTLPYVGSAIQIKAASDITGKMVCTSQWRTIHMRSNSKFRNIRANGFDSRKEEKRWGDLQLMEKLGLISELERQIPYELVPKQAGERAVTYRADFRYREDGQLVVEDAKGVRTDAYIIKRKLLKWVHGITIRET